MAQDDDRTPDDDADTPPRLSRARTYPGEIVERRPRRMMTSDERALGGFRMRDTGPLDAVPGDEDAIPIERGEEPTPPIPEIADPDVAHAFRIVTAMIRRRRLRDANHTLEIEHAVARAERPAGRKVARDVATAVLIALATGLLGLFYDKVQAVGELHDRVLTLELRETALEKALGSIAVLRVVLPGKDPSP